MLLSCTACSLITHQSPRSSLCLPPSAQGVDLDGFFEHTTADKFHTAQVRAWAESLRADRARRRQASNAETGVLGKRARADGSEAESKHTRREVMLEGGALPHIQPGVFSYGVARAIVSPVSGHLEAVQPPTERNS
jgi:hypothetical protein